MLPRCCTPPLIALASVLVIVGGIAQVYVIIIGGQVYPLDLFPGREVSSSFFDGVVASYSPSWPEIGLGVGGMALSMAIVALAVRILPFLPDELSDSALDPHEVPDMPANAAAASDA